MAGMIPPGIQAFKIFILPSNGLAPILKFDLGHNIVAVAPAFISVFHVAERYIKVRRVLLKSKAILF